MFVTSLDAAGDEEFEPTGICSLDVRVGALLDAAKTAASIEGSGAGALASTAVLGSGVAGVPLVLARTVSFARTTSDTGAASPDESVELEGVFVGVWSVLRVVGLESAVAVAVAVAVGAL